MRHNRDWRKLNRTASHRRAMLRNMVTSLFAEERIRTTSAKAKEARRVAERIITFARRGDLSARRHVAKTVNDPVVLKKLFDEIAPRYVERPGGYTRILKVGIRRGDAAQEAILELVGSEEGRKKKGKARKKRQKVEVPAPPGEQKGKAKKKAEAGEAAGEAVAEAGEEPSGAEEAGETAGAGTVAGEKASGAEANEKAAGNGKPDAAEKEKPEKGEKK
jgi:large subunit ribosomal protein L17